MHALSLLHAESSNIEGLRSRPKELQNVLNRLAQLRSLADATSGKVNREEEQVAECRTHVQVAYRHIQQLQPWLDHAEAYLSKRYDYMGAFNLSDARQLYDQQKVKTRITQLVFRIFQKYFY